MTRGLVATDLRAGYGHSPVLFDVDIQVAPGEIVAVLGHNGAGKSTLLKALFGLLPLSAGRIDVDGVDVSAAPTHARVRRGLAYSPQQDFVFRSLTVGENLRLARFGVPDDALVASRRNEVLKLFPVLAERMGQGAGTLSGGQQRMLSIGIALLTEPTLILLDEPSLGLAPRLLHEVMTALRALVERGGIGIMLVEQNVREAATIADRVVVLRRGTVIHHGSGGDELLAREELWELF